MTIAPALVLVDVVCHRKIGKPRVRRRPKLLTTASSMEAVPEVAVAMQPKPPAANGQVTVAVVTWTMEVVLVLAAAACHRKIGKLRVRQRLKLRTTASLTGAAVQAARQPILPPAIGFPVLLLRVVAVALGST